jgi:hypothetical protein
LNAGWRGSPEAQAALDAFWQGLREHGYLEGGTSRWSIAGPRGGSPDLRWNSRA